MLFTFAAGILVRPMRLMRPMRPMRLRAASPLARFVKIKEGRSIPILSNSPTC